MTPIAFAGEHRGPAVLVIFRPDVAPMIARVEGVEPSACAETTEGAVEHHISSTKAIIDPAPAIIGIAHLSPALERLRLELRPRTEIGDHACGIEARPPAPLEV